jgi:hypothetical protein
MCAAFNDAQVFDTVRIARRRFGRGGNGLQRLAARLGIQPVVAHRALADAQTTHLVFEKLIEPVGGWQICLADAIRAQGEPMGLLPSEPRQNLLPLELEEALEMRLPVMMEYLDANKNRTNRVIRPLQIRRRNGEMILIAHCQLRNDQRTFKIDRIVRLTRMAEIQTESFTTETTESTEKCERGEGLGLNSSPVSVLSVVSVPSVVNNNSTKPAPACNSDPASA